MRKSIFKLCLIGALIGGYNHHVEAQELSEVGKGWSQTSVNTPVFRNNSLVTYAGKQYIAYYDSEGFLTLGSRTNGSNQWTLKRSVYKGNCKDAHNTISLMVDGKGYLHVAFDHHGTPLKYCRSKAPGSLELGELIPMINKNEKNVTYPEFYSLKDGDLLFAYRDGASGNGNLVLNRYNVKKGKWKRIQDVLIDGEQTRNAYWQLYVDSKGTIHLSWVWRETPDVATNHDICYARSTNGGKTWTRSNGKKYKLPITADNAEYAWKIPQNSELINQTSMTADTQGNPYIATYWRDAESKVPQYRLVWYNGNEWKLQQISERVSPFSLSGGGTKLIPMARPRLAVRQKDGKTEAFYLFRDVERGSKVSLAYTENLGKTEWSMKDLTDFPVGAWEPSYDTELWKNGGNLDIYVQHTSQGDGERSIATKATPVYVLSVNPNQLKIEESDNVRSIIYKVNAYWQNNHKPQERSFWDPAAYHTGNMEAYFLTKNPEYKAYSEAWAKHNHWKGATSDDKANWKGLWYGEGRDFVLFGDWQICFQTYADLYNLDEVKDPNKIARAREVMEYEMSTPEYKYWWWADGLYMVMPVMTKLYKITKNPLYLEKLYQYYAYADSLMFDQEEHLYYRDGKYVYPKHKSVNGMKDFWARGDGWVLAGLAKVLADLPKDYEHRPFFLQRYNQLADAVKRSQQPEGYWTRSILDKNHAPGPETSGTAFFTYGLLWGINNGYLDEATYMPTVQKAWKYLTETALQNDGRIGYVQPIGERAIPGQTVDANSTANFGVGAFLLTACEMERYLKKK